MNRQLITKLVAFSSAVTVLIAITTGCDDPSGPISILQSGKVYTITFDSQGADTPAYPPYKEINPPARTIDALPTDPVMNGAIFAGWTTKPNGGGKLFTQDTRVTGTLTVYASWSTPGLEFTLINDGREYSVQKGTADTSGTVRIPGYWNGIKVSAVGAYGFKDCRTMTDISIPNHVMTIQESAFYGCIGLTGVTLPGELATIGTGAFYACSGLAGISIPGNVTEIGQGAFAYCTGLADLSFAEKGNLTFINDYAFGFCTGLDHVTLPASITAIGHRAFYKCDSLTTITVNSVNPPETCVCMLFNCPLLSAIKVPEASVETYKETTGWSNYAYFIVSQLQSDTRPDQPSPL